MSVGLQINLGSELASLFKVPDAYRIFVLWKTIKN